ncbi:MAG TPA: tripartite tricarboxylate transporter TctB family protein [Stellaceae bacterium]|jgi:hypothetical protein|nr:tripartite tricarboxylate transporter TctB family protein [Stellaceae bacterium]
MDNLRQPSDNPPAAGAPFHRSFFAQRDLYAGLLVMALGLGSIVQGLHNTIGSLLQMGPGYFPIALGALLAFVGLLIVLSTFMPDTAAEEADGEHGGIQLPDWRGCIAIVLGVSSFIAVGVPFGLAPATFACVFISALGDRQSSLKGAFVLAIVLTTIAVVIFWWGLKVQFPVLRW